MKFSGDSKVTSKMIQAAPYILLGVFLTIELAMIIAGCLLDKNAYPIITLAPTIFALICQFLADTYSDGLHEEGLLTVDVFNYFLGVGLICSIGVPLILFHNKTIKEISLGIIIAGIVLQVIGYWIYSCMHKRLAQDSGF